MAGGCSWTKNWLQFDNSYYQRIHSLLKKSDVVDNANLLVSTSTSMSSSTASSNRTKVQTNLNPTSDDENDDVLLWLTTDWALYNSSEFRPHFLRYASDQNAFFEDYADAHKKLSELGAQFDPPEGIRLPFIDIAEYINN